MPLPTLSPQMHQRHIQDIQAWSRDLPKSVSKKYSDVSSTEKIFEWRNELAVYQALKAKGFSVQPGKAFLKVEIATDLDPDWYASKNSYAFLLDAMTLQISQRACQRVNDGYNLGVDDHSDVVNKCFKKVSKYKAIVDAIKLPFIVCIIPDPYKIYDASDIQDKLAEDKAFEPNNHPDSVYLSTILLLEPQAWDGTWKFQCIENPNAKYPVKSSLLID